MAHFSNISKRKPVSHLSVTPSSPFHPDWMLGETKIPAPIFCSSMAASGHTKGAQS
jgi:hypothetical protein